MIVILKNSDTAAKGNGNEVVAIVCRYLANRPLVTQNFNNIALSATFEATTALIYDLIDRPFIIKLPSYSIFNANSSNRTFIPNQ
ncbi:hypothetical protein [Collinsella sp. UBA1693]|uniref:hypothetical protein n=1 Tax=Collinsella sp. UBA1693 TaxID=1946385 RepID=UPI002579865F|nr:hypothetical protein [Collinsella sp. UBA1693]